MTLPKGGRKKRIWAGVEAEAVAREIGGQATPIRGKDVIELDLVAKLLRPGEKCRRMLHRAEDGGEGLITVVSSQQRHAIGIAAAVGLNDDDKYAIG